MNSSVALIIFMKIKKKKINIYFILAGENLFHPRYLRKILEHIDKDKFTVSGVSIAKEKYSKGFIDFVIKMIRLWRVKGFFAIFIMSSYRSIATIFRFKKNLTVETVAQKYKIPCIFVENVNNEKHITLLKKKSIDIIISSNGQIFKKKLLDLPKFGCVNRHTAILPKYAGVLPVFWAMYFEEKFFGVTMHYMVEKIDEGKIILQKEILLKKDLSLFNNYLKAFDISVDATLESLDKIVKQREISKYQNNKVEYFSFPTNNQLKQFHKKNKVFFLKDIFAYLDFYN
jgi:folate-dependent phosphoribosylglycinamide formyltransferase PurN